MAGKFRPLCADEIECRVQSCKEKGLVLLLYKTARTDADLLDETFGPDAWQNDFKLVDGVLYGGIGIDYTNGGGVFCWKWDAGTESNTEAEKGRASDAFKRAGFKHGIGRELYTAPFIWIPSDKCNISKDQRGNWTCRDTFTVSRIEYKDGNITALEIKNGAIVAYTMRQFAAKEQPKEPIMSDKCAECGKVIVPWTKTDGTQIRLADQIKLTYMKYGKQLCTECATKAKSALTENAS